MVMVDKELNFSVIKKTLNAQLFGVLATKGEEYPYATLIGFAMNDECNTLVFATIRDTRKFNNLYKNPKVSFLVDSSTNSNTDIKDAVAVTILGEAHEIKDNDYLKYQSILLRKHPYLREFIVAPNCALIAINIERFIMVNNLQNVIEISLS